MWFTVELPGLFFSFCGAAALSIHAIKGTYSILKDNPNRVVWTPEIRKKVLESKVSGVGFALLCVGFIFQFWAALL